MRQARQNGFTLLEITVILVLLAVAAAVVAPAFRSPDEPNDRLPALVAGARELAVRRAETLVLQVSDQGTWRLTPAGDTTTLGSGSLNSSNRAIRIRVTPLGACFNEGSGAVDWIALTCARTGSGTR